MHARNASHSYVDLFAGSHLPQHTRGTIIGNPATAAEAPAARMNCRREILPVFVMAFSRPDLPTGVCTGAARTKEQSQ
ncbi:MAG: hypothetical protein WAK33_23080, partial [Silvibacterium sp.]